jgi:hypothetical protein
LAQAFLLFTQNTMKKLLTFLLTGLILQTQAQQFYTELYGFKLGQYRETAQNQLGEPFQSEKYDDGFEYEVFLLKPDTSLYIVFEYAAGRTDIIWSIQVAGSDSTVETGFKNAKLGINKDQVEKYFGTPETVEEIGEYGHKWAYGKSNFSVEVNTKGQLSSIKILDNSSELFPGAPDLSKIPAFEKIQKTLNSSNNADILSLLSGDIAVIINDTAYFFKRSFATEQSSDYSKLISRIRYISKDLSNVNTKKHGEYEENMRLTLGEAPSHIIKIKKGHMINEIVLKYYGGKYLIYEINAKVK